VMSGAWERWRAAASGSKTDTRWSA
jgi:hypothetical protein